MPASQPAKSPQQIAQDAVAQLLSAPAPVHPPQPPAPQAQVLIGGLPVVHWPGLSVSPATPVPAYQPHAYTFTLVSYKIDNTRSVHEDTNHVSLSFSVGGTAATTLPIKDMGDENNGTFNVGMSVTTSVLSDQNIGVVFNYQVFNSGHASKDDIDKVLTTVGNGLASAGAKAATTALGTAVGLATGSMILPIIGSALGAAAVGSLVRSLGC